jgi:exopolysaccharide biosynthesis protein
MLEDTIPQNINLLLIDTRKRTISLLYDPARNVKTSSLASESGALAAVNAGFFNIREGGSQTYIKIAGKVVDSDTSLKWQRVENLNGSIVIDTVGNFAIVRAMPNAWYDSCLSCRDALITGPLLVMSGEKIRLPSTSVVVNRHPRTCAGRMKNGRIVLMTLDGRSEQAAGMTLVKLADLMISLKCVDAVNLDGGGSTTMWISGKPSAGVVNMPSDNRRFDHEGERPVADILVVK